MNIRVSEKEFERFKKQQEKVLNEAESISQKIMELIKHHKYNSVCMAIALVIKTASDLGGNPYDKTIKDIQLCIDLINRAERVAKEGGGLGG